jgi:putative DNA primase/helicase
MRERYPVAVLMILADLMKATGKPDPHAVEAERAIGGLLAFPDFGENRPEGATDFNDLHRLRGAEAVRACVERAMAPGGGEEQSHSQDAVARLAALSPIEYDRVRQMESDALGVRVTTLDAEVEKARRKLAGDGNDSQGEAVLFPDIEPWPSR